MFVYITTHCTTTIHECWRPGGPVHAWLCMSVYGIHLLSKLLVRMYRGLESPWETRRRHQGMTRDHLDSLESTPHGVPRVWLLRVLSGWLVVRPWVWLLTLNGLSLRRREKSINLRLNFWRGTCGHVRIHPRCNNGANGWHTAASRPGGGAPGA